MRKKEIMAILSLVLVSGGFVVGDIHDYNTQSDAIKYECIKIDSPTDKIEKLSKECEEYKRQIYIEDQVNKLREEKRLEEERKRQEELRRQQEEQTNQVVINRGGDVPCGREVTVEVSFYDNCTLCTPGYGITASGKQIQEGMIACPSDVPFGTQIIIDEVTYTCEDTGSYIRWVNGVMRVDIYVSSHEEALRRGRYTTKAIILN